MIDEKKNSGFSEDDKELITDDERGIDDTLILSRQQATFTVTHFTDAFIAVDHAGCTVVSRTSITMRARDGVFWNGYLTIASTGLADSLPTWLDPAGCAVVHRSSTAMKASDHRHVCSSLSLYTIYFTLYE
ncbi:MAG: hypothetical protein Q8O28_07715 [Smithellaceae bacterium]|nr:hypothetical protein [Smithellaceae bacterium]